jgi:hypothetical protein
MARPSTVRLLDIVREGVVRFPPIAKLEKIDTDP